MLLAVFVWTLVTKLPCQKGMRIINTVLFRISCTAIVYITIFVRTPGNVNQLVLIPFHSFVEAKVQPELYRSMLMNCLLFVPFGSTMPFMLSKAARHKVLRTILLAAVFSSLIELHQYLFLLGRAEIDDIICNTIGAAFGSLSYVLNYSARNNRNLSCNSRRKIIKCLLKNQMQRRSMK